MFLFFVAQYISSWKSSQAINKSGIVVPHGDGAVVTCCSNVSAALYKTFIDRLLPAQGDVGSHLVDLAFERQALHLL